MEFLIFPSNSIIFRLRGHSYSVKSNKIEKKRKTKVIESSDSSDDEEMEVNNNNGDGQDYDFRTICMLRGF